MKLYGYYRSSAAYRIRIALNFKGLACEHVPVMLNRGEHRQEPFRRVHPAGFVPVLECEGERVGQSAAIAEFLEERHPEPPLLPAGALERARVRELMGVIGCDVHPLQNLRVLNYLRAEYGQDDDGVAAWCRTWIAAGFATYEALAGASTADGRYSFGDRLTLADAWLVPQVYNADRFGLDLEPFPTIRSIAAHCATLEAVAAAHPSRQPDAPP
ncbi:MAG TPA: maleylacetoacetate isomerase [Woeseiaceae bacterium]|nr:maleylacetoacetate isomerase [Woeseiaceae bacterium]